MWFLPKRSWRPENISIVQCKVCMFWDELKVVLNSLNILVGFDIKDVVFEILDTDNISILLNYILLESR